MRCGPTSNARAAPGLFHLHLRDHLRERASRACAVWCGFLAFEPLEADGGPKRWLPPRPEPSAPPCDTLQGLRKAESGRSPAVNALGRGHKVPELLKDITEAKFIRVAWLPQC